MPLDLATSPEAAYHQLTGYVAPNPMQLAVWERIVRPSAEGIGFLLRAPTGSGKTEAVGVPALVTGKRLILVYPTRSLVDDQIIRFSALLERLSASCPDKPVTLTVDTGAASLRYVWLNGERQRPSGNPHRHLYQGDAIITTLDKFLYRFFGFGEPKKSYIFPLRINYGLRDALICFDEAHSYDDVAFTNFARLIQTLYQRGRNLVLMTATLPKAKIDGYLDFLDQIDFTDDPTNRQAYASYLQEHFPQCRYPERRLRLVPAPINTEDESNEQLVTTLTNESLARFSAERRLIVIAERVRDAVAVWRALKSQLPGDASLWLYHGRLTEARRQTVYNALKQAEDRNSGYLLVTTSAIEVGCDLDAHYLITQRCDPDRLIQRAGRCNRRHQIPDAEVVVVGDTIPAWLTALSPPELLKYDAALNAQAGRNLEPAPLLACLQRTPTIDFRAEMMFDMLYEYVYGARLENKPLHDKGLVITRSWEPSLTLCTGLDANNRPQNAVSVPMRSCKAGPDESQEAGWTVGKFGYDSVEGRFVWRELGGWECAYSVDVIANPNPTLFDFNEEEGWVELPKLFTSSFTRGYRRVLIRQENGEKRLLWYIAALEEPEPHQPSSEAEPEEDEELPEDTDGE